jgi:hypothetical protein
MNHDPSPSDHGPDETRLEEELRRLRPQALPQRLRDEIVESTLLTHQASASLDDFAASLRETLPPQGVPDSLWNGIQSRLEAEAREAPTVAEFPLAEPEAASKVVALPQWRDFLPVLRVAAAVAIGVFIAAGWFRPDTDSDLVSRGAQPQSQPARQGVITSPDFSPLHDAGQIIPVDRRGVIQGMERRGLLEEGDQVYERFWQTRQDRSLYRVGDDLRVEDEVSREGPVITPLRTF